MNGFENEMNGTLSDKTEVRGNYVHLCDVHNWTVQIFLWYLSDRYFWTIRIYTVLGGQTMKKDVFSESKKLADITKKIRDVLELWDYSELFLPSTTEYDGSLRKGI